MAKFPKGNLRLVGIVVVLVFAGIAVWLTKSRTTLEGATTSDKKTCRNSKAFNFDTDGIPLSASDCGELVMSKGGKCYKATGGKWEPQPDGTTCKPWMNYVAWDKKDVKDKFREGNPRYAHGYERKINWTLTNETGGLSKINGNYIYDNDVGITGTAKQCGQECDKKKDCLAFVYRAADKKCWLRGCRPSFKGNSNDCYKRRAGDDLYRVTGWYKQQRGINTWGCDYTACGGTSGGSGGSGSSSSGSGPVDPVDGGKYRMLIHQWGLDLNTFQPEKANYNMDLVRYLRATDYEGYGRADSLKPTDKIDEKGLEWFLRKNGDSYIIMNTAHTGVRNGQRYRLSAYENNNNSCKRTDKPMRDAMIADWGQWVLEPEGGKKGYKLRLSHCAPNDPSAYLSVQDNGSFIKPRDLATVFYFLPAS